MVRFEAGRPVARQRVAKLADRYRWRSSLIARYSLRPGCSQFLLEKLTANLPTRLDQLFEADPALPEDLTNAVQGVHGDNFLRRDQHPLLGLNRSHQVALLQAQFLADLRCRSLPEL